MYMYVVSVSQGRILDIVMLKIISASSLWVKYSNNYMYIVFCFVFAKVTQNLYKHCKLNFIPEGNGAIG